MLTWLNVNVLENGNSKSDTHVFHDLLSILSFRLFSAFRRSPLPIFESKKRSRSYYKGSCSGMNDLENVLRNPPY
jgi:hypothetical protein